VRTFVTAGAGFTGSSLVHELIRAGHDIGVLGNHSSGYVRAVAALPTERVIEGDIRARHMVFQLAPSSGDKRSVDHPRADSEINIKSTISGLQAGPWCTDDPVRHLVAVADGAVTVDNRLMPADAVQNVCSSVAPTEVVRR
jgi:UDP-glucose 4-epimerase